jgi:hypothetical protein
MIFVLEKALSTIAVTIGKIKASSINLYTNGYMCANHFEPSSPQDFQDHYNLKNLYHFSNQQ